MVDIVLFSTSFFCQFLCWKWKIKHFVSCEITKFERTHNWPWQIHEIKANLPLLPKVRNLRFRRRLPNWSESLSEPPASEAKLSLEAVVEAPRRLRCCWFLKALRCTVGDSTFSLSILKVSRISSFLKCSIVSAISLALPKK